MLHAMLLTDELRAYFISGLVRSEVMVAQVLSKVDGYALQEDSPERDQLVRSQLGDELADLIKGKSWRDLVIEYEEPIDPSEGYVFADLGFIHYGAINWDNGDMICSYIPDRRGRPDHLFSGIEDLLGSEYDMNTASAEFRDMHFERSKIELLLPSHRLISGGDGKVLAAHEPRGVGRPVKWNWEGALAHVVAQAQTPDGLPTGPGAQAKIEAIIADWFMSETGNSPSTSQIRTRAALVTELIERPKNKKAD